MHFLAYTNLWISIAAGLQAVLSYYLINKGINFFVVFFVFCSTLFIYNFLRVIKSKSIPAESYSDQMKWVNAHLKIISIHLLTGMIGSIVLFFFLSHPQKLIVMASGLIALSYNLPFSKSFFTLRRIPFLKAGVISGVWALSTYVLVISENKFEFDWQEFLLRFFFIYALTIPFDIRDLKYDDNSMKTTPQLLGVSGAVFFGWILLLSCFCISFDVFDNKIASLFTAGYLISGITLLFSLKKRNDLFCPIVVDGMIILQVILIIGFGNV